MKLYLQPPTIHGNGGIRRVVEAQYKYLPEFGIEIVDDPMQAEVEAYHVSGRPQNPDAALVLHNHGMMWSEYKFPAWAERVNAEIVDSMRYAYRITSPSQWVTKAIARGVYFPVQTIYHGVELSDWAPMDYRADYILWNKARTDEVSNPNEMQELAKLLPEKKFVSTFGQETENVTLIGNQPNTEMQKIVANAGVYLCTARETFGIGTLEALACGVPVVGWDYGGQSEIIRQGETGLLVPYGDYVALADAVRLVLDKRDSFSRNAVADVYSRWQWRDKISQYAKVYKEAAAWYSAPRPLVSVIVPAHNLGKFLPFTLDSIQRQTMQNFECLVIDDQSEDETPEICRAIVNADVRFRYRRTESNLKLSGVRNYGASAAFGKYIQYVDADDVIPEQTLELLTNALEADRSISIAYGALDLISEDGNYRRRNPFPQEFNWYKQMAHHNQVPTGAMMRREVIEQSGGWRTRQWRAEDAEFWARVTSMGFVAKKVTDETTLLYRTRRQSKGSIEFREYPDHDGNWLANIAWRSANTAIEGTEYLDHYGDTVPQRDLVPFGSQGQPFDDKFWKVSHQQEPLITIQIVGTDHIEDTIDSIQGQFMDKWRIVVVGDRIPGFPFLDFVESLAGIGNHLIVDAGQMFPNDWLLQMFPQESVENPLLPKDKVLLQYVGRNQARTQIRVNSNSYFCYQGATAWVNKEDVEKLMARSQWILAKESALPSSQLADQRK